MKRGDLIPHPMADALKADGIWREDILADWLDRHARKRPDLIAVASGDTQLTYAELLTEANRLARGLADLGINKGDVVAVQLPNIPEFLLSYLALSRIGAVMQTVHMPYREAELEGLLSHSGARAVICVAAFRDYPTAEIMGGLRDRLTDLEFVIVHGPAPDGATALADVPTHGDLSDIARPEPADPNIMLYTSGTTSSPKGVVADSYLFLNNARHTLAEWDVVENDIICSPAPFSHLYGLYALLVALAAGATNRCLPAFTPPDYVQLVNERKPTIIFTGPAHHAACRGMGLYDDVDFSSVRIVVCSGAACPLDLAEWVDAHLTNGKYLTLWGMTELQAGTYNRPGDAPAVRHASSGAAAPGNELRVVDDEDNPLPADQEGELQIRGCSVFSGYYNNPDANAEAFVDGWFRTGDLAKLDADGHLSLTGRSKDVINRGGVKFNPADIETLIVQMPAVQMCAIIPVPDSVLGEKACVVVQPTGEATINLEEITAHLDEQQVAKNKWPERLEIVENLPLTPTMKVIKGRLAAMIS